MVHNGVETISNILIQVVGSNLFDLMNKIELIKKNNNKSRMEGIPSCMLLIKYRENIAGTNDMFAF
jgi:hypothetical protein